MSVLSPIKEPTKVSSSKENKTNTSQNGPELILLCPYCNKSCLKQSTLDQHVDFICKLRAIKEKSSEPSINCSESFRGPASLETNLNQQHNLPGEADNKSTKRLQKEMFQCPACNDVFRYMSDLWEHTNEHHWDLIAEDKHEESLMDYKCENCQHDFKDFNLLKKHIESCNSKASKMNLKCGECGKQFDCQRELLKHELDVHPTIKEICPSVDKTNDMGQPLFDESLQSEHMDQHENIKTPKPNNSESSKLVNNCSMCDHAYRSESLLQDHIRYMHTMRQNTELFNIFKPQCPVCYKTFFSMRSIGEHMRIKHAELLYGDEGTQSLSKLVDIIKSLLHKKKKKRKRSRCQLCGKTFRYKSDVLKHNILKHGEQVDIDLMGKEGERKLECTLLNNPIKQRTDNNNKISQIASHNSEIPQTIETPDAMQPLLIHCPLCDKPFRSRHNMLYHMKLLHQTGDDTLSRSHCLHCSSTYTRRSDLKVSK